MTYQPSNLTDEELVFAHIDDHLDESLSPQIAGRYGELLARTGGDVANKYRKARGNLQMVFQELQLREGQTHELLTLIDDDSTRAAREDRGISHIERTALFGSVLRSSLIFGSLAVLAAGLIFYFVAPTKKTSFDLFSALRWEIESLEKDDSPHWDYPTDNLADAQSYIQRQREMGFTFDGIKPFGDGWQVSGVTVLDYDDLQIPVIHFAKENMPGSLYMIFARGNLAKLPAADPGNRKGLLYQAYGTDAMTIVAWQLKEKEEKVLGIIVATTPTSLGPQDLAEYARVASGL